MKKSIYNILLILISILAFNSCIEEEDIELNKYPDYLIVRAELLLDEFAVVDLNYSRDFALSSNDGNSDQINRSAVSNAHVILKDSNGIEELLEESTFPKENGRYYSKLIKGAENTSYELLIDVDGKHYSATSRIGKPIKVDKVKFRNVKGKSIDNNITEDIEIDVSWKDRKNEKNFYLLKIRERNINKEKNELIFIDRETFLFSDLNNDGNDIKYTCEIANAYYLGSYYNNGYRSLYAFLCLIDEQTYTYLKGVKGHGRVDNSIITARPGNLPTNIRGHAFGLFNACPASSMEIDYTQ
ncbi:MAG: DUF4249 family protein [Hyphomicrobiales bacterium]